LIKGGRPRDLGPDSDWLLFAATLIWWKSRALLPSDPALVPAQTDQMPPELARELRERERERAQAAAQLLQAQLARENGIFSRPSIKDFREPLPPEAEDAPFFSLFDLIRLFEDLQRQSRLFDAAKYEPPLEIAPEEVSTEEMIRWFREQMAQASGQCLDGSALLHSQESPARRNALFAAFLEGGITVIHAGLIARLPQDRQAEAFEQCWRKDYYRNKKQLQPANVLSEWLQSNVYLNFAEAPVDTEDATLLADAGDCPECPKQSGFNSRLFRTF